MLELEQLLDSDVVIYSNRWI